MTAKGLWKTLAMSALGRDAQIRRSRVEPHRSFTFENNVVYWENGKLLDGRWGELRASFDGNVYWQANKQEPRFDRLTWKQWREKGMDTNGLVADPLFVDAARKDFRLRDDSPARKLVSPIDLSRVGPLPGQ